MRDLFAGTPWAVLGVLASLVLGAAALDVAGVVPHGVLGVAGITAGLGGLLATALAWAGTSRPVMLAAIVLVGAGAALARLHPIGAAAYVGPPVLIAQLAADGRLRRLGLGTPCPASAVGLGAVAGLFLGAHLLLSATQTFGYRIRFDLTAFGPAVLYDVGAQVLATELFFRGALFNRAQRRWSLGVAVAISTAPMLGRYLVDPLLPHAVEIVLGMMFYVSLLATVDAWLLWRFGTLVPGLIAAWLFFSAYRTLATH